MSHAKLSPSGAKRWLTCTLAPSLEEQFGDGVTGDAALEGTLAHRVSELLIGRQLGLFKQKYYETEIAKCKENKFYSPSMLDYCEDYTTYVVENFHGLQEKTPDAIIVLEEKFDLTRWIPEGFGTGDVTIIGDGLMRVIDLKFGKGIFISSENNEQAKIYALGAYHAFGHLYAVDTVLVTIYQPRLDNISDFEISVKDLLEWSENYLKPRATMAWEGTGVYSPGEHCRFCKAKAVCTANANEQLQITANAFKEPDVLSPEEISDILGRLESYKIWATAVQEYALEQAVLNNMNWPGFKLVHGKSSRMYLDKDKVIERLKERKFKSEDYLEVSLLPITRLEKAIGKQDFDSNLSDLIGKTTGAITLAPVSDKRPAIDRNAEAAKIFE